MATNDPREGMVDFSVFRGVPETYLAPSPRAHRPAMRDMWVDFSILGGWADDAQPIGPSYEDWTRRYPHERQAGDAPADFASVDGRRSEPAWRRHETGYRNLLNGPGDVVRERNELLGPASKEGRVAELRGYDRTKRERIAGAMMDAIAGDKRPTSLQRKLVGGVMGSTGPGSTGPGLVDISPFAPVLASDEFQHAVRNEDWLSALLALLGVTSIAGRAGRSIVGDVRALGQNPFKGKTPEQIDAMFSQSRFLGAWS